MPHGDLCRIDVFQECAHVANEMTFFELLEFCIFHEIYDIEVSSNTSSFHVYTLSGVTELISVENIDHIFLFIRAYAMNTII